MTSLRIREAMHATPFRPFTLRTADDREVRVDHPGFIAVAPSGRTATAYGLDDSSVTPDILITRLEIPAEEPPRPGKRRKAQ